MTFAVKVSTLLQDLHILENKTTAAALESCQARSPVPGFTIPWDHEMFLALRAKGRVLAMPVPAYSTHGESGMLSPTIDWQAVAERRQH